ncbi:MAG: mannose-6-phosphate isomerase, class I [Terrimesophilobacter sp.]
MFVPITNTPRNYGWGSTTAISELLGRDPSGEPEAELWLGAHPGSPAVIVGDRGPATDLAAWIEADPRAALGSSTRLPFLLKVLAAKSALSLQAHPTTGQAAAGFARENALGIPVDAAQRNYRDPYAKPEVLYALSPTVDALCGFRPLQDTRELFENLGLADLVPEWDSIAGVFAWLLSGEPGVSKLVERAVTVGGGTDEPQNDIARDTIRRLAAEHPGDPGIVGALLLNRVRLRAGEALFLPAGNIHAYLHGVGIELMEASDNVLRGGLTSKHIDVPELLDVLDFTPQPVPYLPAEPVAPGVDAFRPAGCGFQLVHLSGNAQRPLNAQWLLDGPAIVLCTSGEFTLDSASTVHVSRGDAVYITPDERELTVRGAGTLFLATTA